MADKPAKPSVTAGPDTSAIKQKLDDIKQKCDLLKSGFDSVSDVGTFSSATHNAYHDLLVEVADLQTEIEAIPECRESLGINTL